MKAIFLFFIFQKVPLALIRVETLLFKSDFYLQKDKKYSLGKLNSALSFEQIKLGH